MLNVKTVLQGSVRVSDNRVYVTARLTDALTGVQMSNGAAGPGHVGHRRRPGGHRQRGLPRAWRQAGAIGDDAECGLETGQPWG